MTDDATAHITATLLRLRDDTAAAAHLRRGHSTATEHYAYPYLAPLWNQHGPYWRLPLLRLGALAATARKIGNDPQTPLGTFCRRAALGTDPPADHESRQRLLDLTGRRLVWAQTGDIDKLHTAVRNLLTRNDLPTNGLSWTDVTRTYLWWDQPDPEQRQRHRRRLLERFYA